MGPDRQGRLGPPAVHIGDFENSRKTGSRRWCWRLYLVVVEAVTSRIRRSRNHERRLFAAVHRMSANVERAGATPLCGAFGDPGPDPGMGVAPAQCAAIEWSIASAM